jgi:hypothetical protein
MWYVLGIKLAKDTLDLAENKFFKVAELLQATDNNTEIYCVTNDSVLSTETRLKAQWLNPRKTIRLLSEDEFSAREFEPETVFLCDIPRNEAIAMLSDRFRLVYTSDMGYGISVFTQDGSKAGQAIEALLPSVWNRPDPRRERTYINVGRTSKKGFLLRKTDLRRRDGIYEFAVELQIRNYNGSGDIGYITVEDYREGASYTRVLTKNDFNIIGKGRIALPFPVEIMNYSEPVIAVYSYGNCTMEIEDITYQNLRGNVTISGKDAEEIQIISEIVAELRSEGNDYPVCYVDSDSSGWFGFPDFTEVNPYFAHGIEEYLPAEVLILKNDRGGRFLIMETTGDSTTLLALLDDYTIIWEAASYRLMIPRL